MSKEIKNFNKLLEKSFEAGYNKRKAEYHDSKVNWDYNDVL